MPSKRLRKPIKISNTPQKPKEWWQSIPTAIKIIAGLIGIAVGIIAIRDGCFTKGKKESALLECVNVYLDEFSDGVPVAMTFTITNSGNGTGFLKTGKLRYFFTLQDSITVPPKELATDTAKVMNRYIMQGQKIDFTKNFTKPLAVGNKILFYAGKIFLYVAGEITYSEMDKGALKTYTFCVRIMPEVGGHFITVYTKTSE